MQAHLSYIVSLKPAWATGDPVSKWPLTDTWLMTPCPHPVQFYHTNRSLPLTWLTPACGCLPPGQRPAPSDPPHLSTSTPPAPSFLPRMSSSLVPLIPGLSLNVPSEPSCPPQTTVLALTQPSQMEKQPMSVLKTHGMARPHREQGREPWRTFCPPSHCCPHRVSSPPILSLCSHHVTRPRLALWCHSEYSPHISQGETLLLFCEAQVSSSSKAIKGDKVAQLLKSPVCAQLGEFVALLRGPRLPIHLCH